MGYVAVKGELEAKRGKNEKYKYQKKRESESRKGDDRGTSLRLLHIFFLSIFFSSKL